MVLKLKTVTLPGTTVSGGGAVGSGFVNEVKFSDFEKVEDAVAQFDQKRDFASDANLYKPTTVISGNVVAVQLHIMRVGGTAIGTVSGIVTSGLWTPCIAADYAAVSGATIAVIAEVF